MKSIARFRLVLAAIMIFGAFANFALNVWGDSLIVLCEMLMVISFFYEIGKILVLRIKNKMRPKLSAYLLYSLVLIFIGTLTLIAANTSLGNGFLILGFSVLGLSLCFILTVIIEAIIDYFKKVENQLIYENLFLGTFFLGILFKNLHFPGAAILGVFSCIFLLPYYVNTTISFYKTHIHSGKVITRILCAMSVGTVLLGIVYLFKIQHWPGATALFYSSLIFIGIFIYGLLKWNFDFSGKKITILQGLKLLKTKIVFLFFLLFIFTTYRFFTTLGVAPGFYSAEYPSSFYEYNNNSSFSDYEKGEEIRTVYDNFIHEAEKNEFIK